MKRPCFRPQPASKLNPAFRWFALAGVEGAAVEAGAGIMGILMLFTRDLTCKKNFVVAPIVLILSHSRRIGAPPRSHFVCKLCVVSYEYGSMLINIRMTSNR